MAAVKKNQPAKKTGLPEKDRDGAPGGERMKTTTPSPFEDFIDTLKHDYKYILVIWIIGLFALIATVEWGLAPYDQPSNQTIEVEYVEHL